MSSAFCSSVGFHCLFCTTLEHNPTVKSIKAQTHLKHYKNIQEDSSSTGVAFVSRIACVNTKRAHRLQLTYIILNPWKITTPHILGIINIIEYSSGTNNVCYLVQIAKLFSWSSHGNPKRQLFCCLFGFDNCQFSTKLDQK